MNRFVTLLTGILLLLSAGAYAGGSCSPSDSYTSPTTLTLGTYSFSNSGCTVPCACTTNNCNGTGYGYDICDQAASSGGSASNGDCSASVNMGGLCTVSGCFCGSAENTNWAQFCPTVTGSYTFNLSSIVCSGGGSALQFGIYQGGTCGGTALTCQGSLTGSSSTTLSLTAGVCYTIVFDGNAGASCTWNFSITTPLPVQLISFTGSYSSDGNIVEWVTASETANRGFEVQVSPDGRMWEMIAFVDGKGDSKQVSSYTFTDSRPKYATAYYRLQQFDYDGNFALLGPVRIKNPNLPSLNLLSTVIRDKAVLTWSNNRETVQIQLYRMNGQLVRSESFIPGEVSGRFELSAGDLQAGIYLLSVMQGNTRETFRIYKE